MNKRRNDWETKWDVEYKISVRCAPFLVKGVSYFFYNCVVITYAGRSQFCAGSFCACTWSTECLWRQVVV